MFRSAWRKLIARKELSHPARHDRPPRQRSRPYRPSVEQLENRTVPTIVFANHYGAETLHFLGSGTLSSPPVYFVFWGSYWTSSPGTDNQNQIINAAQNLFNSGYFSEQKQYGTDGIVTYGGAVNHTSDPPQDFTSTDIENALHHEIDTHNLPESDGPPHQALYAIITPPGTYAQDHSQVGYNAYTYDTDCCPGTDDDVYAWIGGDPANNGNNFNIDTYTQILSHELTEAITDPQTLASFHIFHVGYQVDPGPRFPNPPANSNQIGDYEAQAYTYVVDGVRVQSYWSDTAKNFVIPDDNLQRFNVDGGELDITGDQFSKPENDVIFINETADGGVFVSLNGEHVAFDKGAIHAIHINPSDGNDTIYVLKTDAKVPVSMQLGSGQDNVYVIPINGLGDIQSSVVVSGGTGTSTLTIDDSGDNGTFSDWTVTDRGITRAGSGEIFYGGVRNIVVNAGGGPNLQTHFDVKDTERNGSTTVNTGNVPFDEVDVQATTGPLTVNDGAGHNDFTIVSQNPRQLDTLQGLVTVNGQNNSDELLVDDRANINDSAWDVSGSEITRSYTIGGASGMTTVTATVDYSAIAKLSLYGGVGRARFDLSPMFHNLDELPADVIVYGTSASDTDSLAVEDGNNSFNSRWDITDQRVTRTYSSASAGTHTANIEYHHIHVLTVNGGNGGNTYNALSTGSPTTSLLYTGAGNDAINVGGGNSKMLDTIQGHVTVIAQGGSDTLNLNDQDSNAVHTYALTATSVTRENVAQVSFVGAMSVVVNGGSAGNIFNVSGISYLAPYTINGGAGGDTVNLNNPDLSDNPNANHQAAFYGQGGMDTLTLNDQANAAGDTFFLGANSLSNANAPLLTLNFDATLENLNVNAGGGDDAFEIIKAPPVTAVAINGGNGTNTLNYGGFTGDITADLPLGVATGLNGGISNIQNVYGSNGNDILVGDVNPNLLQGGTGRNIVIGGAGADRVIGGGGDNVIIGGFTDYDQNLAALDDFMSEWLRTDLNFPQRVVDLRTGGGGVPGNLPPSVLKGTGFTLDPKTVHDDQVTDFLIGNAGSGNDWFFWNPAFDGLSNKKAGDAYTIVNK